MEGCTRLRLPSRRTARGRETTNHVAVQVLQRSVESALLRQEPSTAKGRAFLAVVEELAPQLSEGSRQATWCYDTLEAISGVWAEANKIQLFPLTVDALHKYALVLDAKDCGPVVPTVIPSFRTAVKWVLYGFKGAPAWWSEYRDAKLLTAKIKQDQKLVGYPVTYADDFLILSEGFLECSVRLRGWSLQFGPGVAQATRQCKVQSDMPAKATTEEDSPGQPDEQVIKDYKPHLRPEKDAALLRCLAFQRVWKASKQALIALSSSEAELTQAVEGCMYGESLMTVLADLGMEYQPAELHLDNTASISFIGGAGNQRTRRFKIKGPKIRQLIQSGWVVKHCKGEYQKADLLTKPLPSARVRFLCGLIQLGGDSEPTLTSTPAVRQVSASTTSCFQSLSVLLHACLCVGGPSEEEQSATEVAIEWPWELGVLTLLIVLSTLFLWEAFKSPCSRRVAEPTAHFRAVALDKKDRRARRLQERVAAAIDSAVSESPTSDEPRATTRKSRNKCPVNGEPAGTGGQSPPTVVYGGINMTLNLELHCATRCASSPLRPGWHFHIKGGIQSQIAAPNGKEAFVCLLTSSAAGSKRFADQLLKLVAEHCAKALAGTGATTGKADQYVPVFDNSQRSYKEFRKRCELYRVKMELAGRKQETIFNIVTLLTGKAWDMIDDMSTETFQSDGGYNAVFERLDRGFKYEPLTELPEDFETFFVKLNRKPSQTLQEYAAEFSRSERQLRVTHSVTLPEKVLSWWFLRRSGIGREQQPGAHERRCRQPHPGECPEGHELHIGTGLSPGTEVEQDDYYDDFPAEDWEPAYWQDDGDAGTPWPDHDEDYYDHEANNAVEEEIFDVSEFDEVYASYTDAKAKLNNLRVSRGFYPVVALVDRGQGGGARPGGAGKGRGKGKRGKEKGKGTGGGKQGPVSPKGSTAKARGRQAVGRQICLRCGQSGHWARNCPSATTGDKKRKMEDEDDVMMIAESYALNDEDHEDESNNRAVQDGGAASVLGSTVAVRNYLRYLLEKGVDLSGIPCFPCAKNFRFGNSATGGASKCLLLPMVLEDRKLQILTYVIEGNAPLLFGRPLLKQLGVTVDYENETMRIKDGEWKPIPLGSRGEHQLILSEDVTRLLDDTPYDEILAPDDYTNHVDVTAPENIGEFLLVPEAVAAFEEANLGKHAENDPGTANNNDNTEPNDGKNVFPAFAHDSNTFAPTRGTATETEPKVTNDSHNNTEKEVTALPGGQVKALSKGKLRGLIMQAQAAAKKQKNLLAQASKVNDDNKRVVWQVFSGGGRLSKEVSQQGGKSQNFCKNTGWNLSQPKVRRRLVQKVQEEQPDEILITPPARLWSPMLDKVVNGDPGKGPELRRRRQVHHDEILVFTAVLFETQRRAQCHSGYVDQCEYGLTLPDGNNNDNKLMKKAICFFSTRRTVAYKLQRQCKGDHDHHSDNDEPANPDLHEQASGNYPQKLAENLAKLLVFPEVADDIHATTAAPPSDAGDLLDSEMANPDQEPTDNTEDVSRKNRELRSKVGSQALNYVTRLHKNLGHPSSDVLVRMLEEVQATTNVIEAAKGYVCPTCYARRRSPGVPPAAGLMARNFGDRLLADSAWIDIEGGRRCVLTVMDQATRYVAVRLLESETATEFIKGIERSWIKQFGVPKMLRIDEAKGWSSKALREWSSTNNITLEIAPAECHNWLGAVERKHQVVRRALEIYMDEKGGRTLSHLKEALVYVPGQINNLSFVRGFTPNQWVTGRQPLTSTTLSGDFFNPGADPMDEPTDFARLQQVRLAAQQAFLRADTVARLRRSMNRLYNEVKDQVAVGQKCWYWRIQGTGILQKSKWRGPARVVAIETNDENKQTVVWIAHGANLLRCGPHQVRPLVQDTGCAPVADPSAALADLYDIRARSTTQFRDVYEYEPVLEDALGDNGDLPHDVADYSPSPPASDADDERGLDAFPVPGAAVLYQQSQPRRRRHSSMEEPEPSPSEAGVPPNPPKRTRADPPGLAAPVPASSSTSPPQDVPPAGLDAEMVPVPSDGDSDLIVSDVYVVDGGRAADDLPKGWTIIDGEIAMDEVWLSREVSTKKMTAEERANMMEAKRKELTSYFSNNVWEFTELEEGDRDRIVTARWVLTWKEPEAAGGVPRAKARLVLRGFQDPDLFSLDKASPTATRQSKMLVLAISPIMGWHLYCGDVRTAFLSGASFERRIIVRLPTDCGPLLGATHGGPVFMKMLKSAYGLADAPLLWFQEEGKLVGALILHVDDLLAFDFGKWQELQEGKPLVYCGGKLTKTKEGILLDYGDYLKKVLPITVPKKRDVSEKLSPAEISKVRGLIGALQWPASQGVPPLAASVSILASTVNASDGNLVTELNKTLRFAKTNSKPLLMSRVAKGLEDLCFLCYSDAAFGVRQDCGSQGGYVLVLTTRAALEGKRVPYNLLSWRSFRLPRVCRSSLAAESQASAFALDELMMAKTMLALMFDPRLDPRAPSTAKDFGTSALVIDAKALYDAILKKGFTSGQDKRSAIEIRCVQEELRALGTSLRWVSSEQMLADGATKLAARQGMADALYTGKLCLTYDKEFVAAKKKSWTERQRSVAEAFGDKAYGSRAARQISTILLANHVTTTAGELMEHEVQVGLYGTIQYNATTMILVTFLAILFGIIAGWALLRGSSTSTSTTPTSTSTTPTSSSTTPTLRTATTGTQTDPDHSQFNRGLRTRDHHHDCMVRERDNEIDRLRHYNVELRGEIQGLERLLGEARAAPPPPAPVQDGNVHLAPTGRVYHTTEQCGHLNGTAFRTFRKCRDCP
ncbi:GIP [Symbiodinium sp. CCMP2592]|nr:GIP [Symbiodinium sp. CCMP2592]